MSYDRPHYPQQSQSLLHATHTKHPFVRQETHANPPLPVAYFRLQRGFGKPLIDRVFRSADRLGACLTAHTGNSSCSPMICTSPFYAAVAERWPGPVIYCATDVTVAYDHSNPRRVRALDRRLCAVSTLVCPNSSRIAEYLIADAACDPKKIVCLPNATRAGQIFESFSESAAELPADVARLPRPG